MVFCDDQYADRLAGLGMMRRLLSFYVQNEGFAMINPVIISIKQFSKNAFISALISRIEIISAWPKRIAMNIFENKWLVNFWRKNERVNEKNYCSGRGKKFKREI